MPQAAARSSRRCATSDPITSAPAIWNNCAAKFPTSPSPITTTTFPAVTLELRSAVIATPAIRVNTACFRSAPSGTFTQNRSMLHFTCVAWLAKLRMRSPGFTSVTLAPVLTTSPRFP